MRNNKRPDAKGVTVRERRDGAVAIGAVVCLWIPRTAGQSVAAAQGDWSQGAQGGTGDWSGMPGDAPVAGDA